MNPDHLWMLHLVKTIIEIFREKSGTVNARRKKTDNEKYDVK